MYTIVHAFIFISHSAEELYKHRHQHEWTW